MPGATWLSVACATFERPRNAFIMPHTVPNRPIYGLTEPTEARNGKCASRSSSSRLYAARMARREPSITSETPIPGCCLWRINSLKPASNMLAMPCGLRRPAVTLSYNLFKSPPLQNLFSNSSDSVSARLMVATLIKIYHHENNEVISNIAITACTGRLAPVMSVNKDISFVSVMFAPLLI